VSDIIQVVIDDTDLVVIDDAETIEIETVLYLGESGEMLGAGPGLQIVAGEIRYDIESLTRG